MIRFLNVFTTHHLLIKGDTQKEREQKIEESAPSVSTFFKLDKNGIEGYHP
jgi:hypothetical protein